MRHTLSMKKHNQDVSTTPLVVRLDDDEDGAQGYIFYTLTLCNTFMKAITVLEVQHIQIMRKKKKLQRQLPSKRCRV